MTTMTQSKMNWMPSLHPCWTVRMNSQAQPKRSIITPSKKMVKEIPPKKSTPRPQSVEGIDWVVLQPKTSPMKKFR